MHLWSKTMVIDHYLTFILYIREYILDSIYGTRYDFYQDVLVIEIILLENFSEETVLIMSKFCY
jgi:hypothetical protein